MPPACPLHSRLRWEVTAYLSKQYASAADMNDTRVDHCPVIHRDRFSYRKADGRQSVVALAALGSAGRAPSQQREILLHKRTRT